MVVDKSPLHLLTCSASSRNEGNRLFSTVKNFYLAVEPDEVVAGHLAMRMAEGAEQQLTS
jgi:hypothetical protein